MNLEIALTQNIYNEILGVKQHRRPENDKIFERPLSLSEIGSESLPIDTDRKRYEDKYLDKIQEHEGMEGSGGSEPVSSPVFRS